MLPSFVNSHTSDVSFHLNTVFAPATGLFAIILTVASVAAFAFNVML